MAAPGIQRIASHDFQSLINVGSRDEFAEVADAFHTIYVYSFKEGEAARSENVFFDADDVVLRLSNQNFMHIRRGDKVPGYLRPFDDTVEQWLVIPVFIQTRLLATLNLGYPAEVVRFDEDLRQAGQMAAQMAVALANSGLVRELDQLNEGSLTALARTVDAKSPWTAGHSERVSDMSHQLALILERPYRPGWKYNEVVKFIRENSGSHFDPQVVKAFEYLAGNGGLTLGSKD